MVQKGIYILITFSFVVSSFSISAQDTLHFTLDEVISLAQDQSLDAQIAKHKYRASYWQLRAFRADYLPGAGISATIPNINRSINAISAQDGTTVYTPQNISSYQVQLSISQKIGFTGGTVSLNSGLSRMDNFLPDTSVTQYLTNIIYLAYRQPIFAFNDYKWDKKLEPLMFEEAQQLYIETNEQVADEAVDNFFMLLLGRIEVDIALKNKAGYDTLFQIAKGRYNLGKIAENELLQLELNTLQAETALEDAELNYKNRLFLFKSYLRLQSDAMVVLEPPIFEEHFTVSADKAISEAKNNNSRILDFKRRLIEAESEVNRAKMQGRFDAELFAMFGLTQTDGTLQGSYQNPLDEEVVSLGITIPILDWGGARGRIKMAQSNQEIALNSVEQDKIDFDQNVFLNVMKFNMQENLLKIAAKSDTVAQKRYNVTQKRYMIGKINDVLELNKAQVDNDNAKMGYFRALMTYWKSYYTIRRLTHYDFQRDMPIQVNFEELMN